MPELSLSLDLHLHHGGVGVFDVLQRFFNPRKQVDNLLFADQDLAVGRTRGASAGVGGAPRTPAWSGPYLRCVYRSLRTLSWFWTV